MGALTARAHGPIAAMAALATASASADLPDKSPLRPFSAHLTASHPQSLPSSVLANASIRIYKASSYRSSRSSSSLNLSSVSPPFRSRLSPSPSPYPFRNEGFSVAPFSDSASPYSPRIHGCPSNLVSSFGLSNVTSSSSNWPLFASRNLNLSPLANIFPVSISTELLHAWHSPFAVFKKDDNVQGQEKMATAVVLLGWLGAQQKHLKKYAEWYASRGIHAITFIIPMADLLTLKPGSKAEKHIEMLAYELVRWLRDDAKDGNKEGSKKNVIFHTFSNTGWLTYGAILEWLLQYSDNLLGNIKGCVVDSAPAAKPDPQVWASGFAAALLKKRKTVAHELRNVEADVAEKQLQHCECSLKEAAIHVMLEKFFSVFLKIPYVNRRLSDITTILSQQQPCYPQLYIYSTADDVIPVQLVESFINQQRKSGRTVMACNFEHSPHVDHFRTFPDLYGHQLNKFLKHCFHDQGSE